MEEKFKWATLVVCRAGASTVAEICAVGAAAMFVPLPTAADDHQRKNAQTLVDQGAGILVLQKDFNPDGFIRAVMKLKQERKYLKELGERAASLHNPDATNEIVAHLAKK